MKKSGDIGRKKARSAPEAALRNSTEAIKLEDHPCPAARDSRNHAISGVAKIPMIEIPKEMLERCYAHGAETYPHEACGVLSGPSGDPAALTGFHEVENTLAKLHAEDPQRYPRTPEEGYVLDPLTYMKLDKSLSAEGGAIKVVYHTHVDVGAYFSEEDIKQATWDGNPVLPGIVYLVCGVKARQPDGAILAIFNEQTKSFDTHPVE